MRRLTIHTSNYKSELINFAKSVAESNLCAIKSHPGGINLTWKNSDCSSIFEELLLLLQNIAMYENHVYRHSPKLRDLAEGLKNTELHMYELQQLKAFLKANKELNLEGYVTFRMEAYREKLDMMLYTIVKKINLSK